MFCFCILGGFSAYPANARLYYPGDYAGKRIAGWCANTGEVTKDTMQSLTVDLGRRKKITHIATQGKQMRISIVPKSR